MTATPKTNPADRPGVSVIIPHYDDVVRLRIALDALDDERAGRDDVDVVVADNASPVPRSELEAAVAGRARIVHVAERGAGPARNAGVAASGGVVLAFLDSDCVPQPGWLVAGVAALDRFDVVGGRVLVHVEHEGALSGTEAFERVFAFDVRDYVERQGFAGSGNLFVRRDVFEQVGGFRATVSEDVEWSRRATGLGLRLGFSEAAAVSHPARGDWRALTAKWGRILREGYALARQEGRGARWVARAALLPASIPAHAPRVLRSDRLSGPRERALALATLARLRLWRMAETVRIVAETRRG